MMIMTSYTAIKAAQQFTALELQKMKRMGGAVVSPDGKNVVYQVRVWNDKTGKVSTHLRYTEIATGKTNLLTDENAGFSDMNPVFSSKFPNQVLFLSNRSKEMQVWYVSFPPNDKLPTPVQLTHYEVEIENLKATSTSIFFSAEVYFECQDKVLTCTAAKNKEVSDRGDNSWGVYNRMFTRHWDRWMTEGKGNHIFTHQIQGEEVEGVLTIKLVGEVIDVMKGMAANSPIPPFGGGELFEPNADGSEIVFSAHERTDDESWNTGWKTFYDTSKFTTPLFITGGTVARTQNPRFSPDGSKVSYLAMNRAGLESDNLHLEIYDILTKQITKIPDSLDRSIIDYMWFDGNTILFVATEINTNKIYLLNLQDPTNITILSEDNVNYSAAPLLVDYTSKTLIAQRSKWTAPDDLVSFTLDLANKKISTPKQITDTNSDALAKFQLDDAESFMFDSNGDKVQGWILKPANFDATKKYPLAFLIHGGPEGAWDPAWSYRWNPQLWAHRGYVAVMINPHGSSGQGIKFQDAVRDDWGGVPYQDLMTGLDYALANYKFIDEDRMCACGASYGGYMVNWIQGQTDRFKCLITHDGVFSTLSMFYATEEIWFPYAEYCPRNKLGCNPFDSKFRQRYLKFSPESYVQNWKTPHLIIHGSMDFRIPVSEGLSAFAALQVKGIKSKFLHFSQENHWVLRAENSIKWYDEVIGWMDEFTTPKGEKTEKKFLNDTTKGLKYLEK